MLLTTLVFFVGAVDQILESLNQIGLLSGCYESLDESLMEAILSDSQLATLLEVTLLGVRRVNNLKWEHAEMADSGGRLVPFLTCHLPYNVVCIFG